MSKKIKYLSVLAAMVTASLFFGHFLKNENVSLAQGGGEMIKLPEPATTGKLSVEEAISQRRDALAFRER